MTTSKSYDLLNRLTSIQSINSQPSTINSFAYTYNSANQRTAVTNADNSRWAYGYDSLGQVTSGKKYWSDSSAVAGQQFDYTFDSIGNRKNATRDTRQSDYTVNLLNQYTNRTVPGYVNVIGEATNAATVSVNYTVASRKGDYFRAEVLVSNSAPLWQGLTNLAVLNQGTNSDIISTNLGRMLIPQTPESFTYDADGNLTSDSLWTNTWNAENRRITIESRSGVPTAGKVKEDWTYLPDGRWVERIVSTNNGTIYVAIQTNRYVWDGQVLLAVLNHTNGLELAFMRGLDLSGVPLLGGVGGGLQGAGGVGGLLAVVVGPAVPSAPLVNTAHFACYDGNGNVAALVNAADGIESARYEYGPFNEPLRITGVMGKANPIRFSTQYADDFTSDLKYLYRDLRDGRWLSRDPIEERGGVQPYALVANCPVSHVDVLGLVKFLFKQILGDRNSLNSIFGNMDELTQPQGHGKSMLINSGWSATSAITVSFFRPGKWCCNSIDSDAKTSNDIDHQDSTALILYMTDAAPGTYTINLRGSASAVAERGALREDPAVVVKIYNRAAPGNQRIIDEIAGIDDPVSESKAFTATVTILSKSDTVYLADYIPIVRVYSCGKIAAIGTLEVLSYVDPTGVTVSTAIPNPYE